MSLTYDPEKFDSCLNFYRELFSNPYNIPTTEGNEQQYESTILIPLDFSLEIDGISGIIPNSAFEVPSNVLPTAYLTKNKESKIAFILHTIDHNFSNNKWTTKLTGQTLLIRFDPLSAEEIAARKAKKEAIKKPKKGGPPKKPRGKGSGKGYDYINQKYGEIGDQSNLTRLTFPYPMYFDGKLVKTTQVHKLVQKQLTDIFNDILTTFGLEKIKKLGLDQFSGLYNVRNKRGGSTPSIHSWGIAIDLYAAKNGLNQKTGNALFSKDEYKSFIDIWYKYGFKSFGRELGYDWMHFQVNDVIF
jgi:hypothetical protein